MKLYGVYLCNECRAGESCRRLVDTIEGLYVDKEKAKDRIDAWARDRPGCYVEEDEAICYYDVCNCEKEYHDAPCCDYQAYLKAGDWAGLEKIYIKEIETDGTDCGAE